MVAISSKKNLLCKLASVSKSWRAYEVLKDDYILLKIHNWKSLISTHIDNIDSALAAIKALLLQIIYLKPLPDMNASILSVTFIKKSRCIQSVMRFKQNSEFAWWQVTSKKDWKEDKIDQTFNNHMEKQMFLFIVPMTRTSHGKKLKKIWLMPKIPEPSQNH